MGWHAKNTPRRSAHPMCIRSVTKTLTWQLILVRMRFRLMLLSLLMARPRTDGGGSRTLSEASNSSSVYPSGTVSQTSYDVYVAPIPNTRHPWPFSSPIKMKQGHPPLPAASLRDPRSVLDYDPNDSRDDNTHRTYWEAGRTYGSQRDDDKLNPNTPVPWPSRFRRFKVDSCKRP
ncbi:hypothetical protein F5I97DRAFT_1284884 [Phlebopus sp. FC_14]|nr:hypothetical protein F5I97DRAFT_1284884 [Phlebopus sp. FC_14]